MDVKTLDLEAGVEIQQVVINEADARVVVGVSCWAVPSEKSNPR